MKQLKPQDNYAYATVKGSTSVKKVGNSYVNIIHTKSMQWERVYASKLFNYIVSLVIQKIGSSYKYFLQIGSTKYELAKNPVTSMLKSSDNGKKAKVIGSLYYTKDINRKDIVYVNVKNIQMGGIK